MVFMALTGLLVPSSCIGQRGEQNPITNKVRASIASKVRVWHVICHTLPWGIKIGVDVRQFQIRVNMEFTVYIV